MQRFKLPTAQTSHGPRLLPPHGLPRAVSDGRPATRAVWIFVIWLMFAPLVVPRAAAQAGITVAAASDLSFALPQLAHEFERQTGQRVRLVFGSSGNLFTQIQNGAPYDVYLSADVNYPRRLADSGTGLRDSYTVYAIGKLVLFARADSPLDVEKLGMQALLAPSVQRIAIANPQHAPYGAAAVAALRKLNLYNAVAPRLAIGENVSQAAQFVVSGNAQVALTAFSVARAQPGKIAFVPDNAYPPIQQAGIALRRSWNPSACRGFLRFLSSDLARDILRRSGFALPDTQPQRADRD